MLLTLWHVKSFVTDPREGGARHEPIHFGLCNVDLTIMELDRPRRGRLITTYVETE